MTRRILIVAGAGVIGFALWGLLGIGGSDLVGVAVLLVALVVAHDGVFLPVVLAAGAVLRRVVPPRWRSTVQVAAVVSLAVTAVGLPLALGFGRPADNASALPLPYTRNLLLIVGLIWIVAVAGRKGFARLRARRGR